MLLSHANAVTFPFKVLSNFTPTCVSRIDAHVAAAISSEAWPEQICGHGGGGLTSTQNGCVHEHEQTAALFLGIALEAINGWA